MIFVLFINYSQVKINKKTIKDENPNFKINAKKKLYFKIHYFTQIKLTSNSQFDFTVPYNISLLIKNNLVR